MGIKCGIVGLPNVGKSTLFNALTKAGIAAANFPFCTIDPNVGVVPVPDPRLNALAGHRQAAEGIPTAVEFVDIAGLVAGAASGEGLGNKFLAHIREVDAITHVVRCFENADVVHVANKVDPICRHRDHRHRAGAGRPGHRSTRRCSAPSARPRPATRTPRRAPRCCGRISAGLNAGKPARSLGLSDEDKAAGARPVPADAQAGDVRRQRARGRLREQPAPGRRPRARGGRRRRGRAGLGRDRGRAEPARRRRPRRLPARPRPGRARPEPRDPRRLQAAGPADLLHRRREGSPRLDGARAARPRRRRPA